LGTFLAEFSSGASEALDERGSLRLALDRFFDFAVSTYSTQGLGCFVFGTAPAASSDPDIRVELAKALDLVQGAPEQRVSRSIGDELVADVDVAGLATALSRVLLALALPTRAALPTTELGKMHQRFCHLDRSVSAATRSGRLTLPVQQIASGTHAAPKCRGQ